jgi:nuclear GTP-binding protein
MLRNCVDADSIEDPIPAIETLLKRCSTESLMMTYSIPAFPKDDVMIFLAMVAKRNGRVLKGGIPDKVMAARGVLKDWNSGKIPFYTRPPTDEEYKSSNQLNLQNDAKILSGFDDAFDVSQMDNEVINSLEEKDEMDFVQMEPEFETRAEDAAASKAVQYLTRESNDDSDEEMDDEDDEEDEESNEKPVNNDMLEDAEDYDFDL